MSKQRIRKSWTKNKRDYIIQILESCETFAQRQTVLEWVDDLIEREVLTKAQGLAIRMRYRSLRRQLGKGRFKNV